MKRYAWMIALGLLALLAFAASTLPSGIVAGRLGRVGVQATAFDGTIWNGRATGLTWRNSPVGDLEWRLTPLSLLRMRVAGHTRLTRADGSLDTDFDAGLAGDLRLAGTSFDLPLELLASLPLGMPQGWKGHARGRLDEIVVTGGWPTTLRGTLDMENLVAPPPRNAEVGSYHVVLPHPRPTGEGSLPEHLTAQVTDTRGPFSIDAQLSIAKDRSFLLEGTVAPRGQVPPGMAQSLELLGPADAAGRRPFSVSGTL